MLRCRNGEISTEESCECEMELAQERGYMYIPQEAADEMWLPRQFHHEPQVPDKEAQHLMFALLGFSLTIL